MAAFSLSLSLSFSLSLSVASGVLALVILLIGAGGIFGMACKWVDGGNAMMECFFFFEVFGEFISEVVDRLVRVEA